MSTYFHADDWAFAIKQASPGVKVAAMPDSGFVLDHNYTEGQGFGATYRWA
jgi:hypothetical protein